MPGYAALLRGVNVGGKGKLAMEDLRKLLSALGYAEPRTLLQSGNAVFTSRSAKPEEIARRIERALQEELGMAIRCLVRSAAELRAVIEGNPLQRVATDGSRMLALFLSAAPDAKLLSANDPTQLEPEHIRLGDRVIYQWVPEGFLKAPNVSAFVEKKWKLTVTARNWNTVTKLHAMLAGG